MAAGDEGSPGAGSPALESGTDSGLNKDKRFGTNSYHYWHDHGKERAARGDVAPIPKPKLVATDGSLPQERRKKPIEKYSWGDGKKFVTVYVPYPEADKREEDVSVRYGKSSVRLTVREEKADVVLQLVRLNGKIVGAESSLKFKADQIVVKLKKEEERTWYDLKKTSAAGGGDSDSDDL